MIKSGFDLVAPYYDFLAGLVFGRDLQKAQLIFLNHLPAKARILIVGGGTGWLLPELFSKAPDARVVYLEASQNMLYLAKQKSQDQAWAASVEFRLGTEQNILTEEKFDAVISYFLFDLFLPEELEEIVKILNNGLCPGGTWLVTDFVKTPGFGLRQLYTKVLTKCMYAFFRVLSGISATRLPDWENMLTRHNLVQQKTAYFYHNMIKAAVYLKT